MKFYPLILIFFCLIFARCKHESVIKVNCDGILEEYNMVPYHGQEIGCKMTLGLYEFENVSYYVLSSVCIDMILFPVDCDGNKLCETISEDCLNFYDHSVFIGTVGIRE